MYVYVCGALIDTEKQETTYSSNSDYRTWRRKNFRSRVCVTADRRREAQQHFQCSSFKGRETVIVNQTSIGSVSKATLGKLLRDGVERIDTILNWTELSLVGLLRLFRHFIDVTPAWKMSSATTVDYTSSKERWVKHGGHCRSRPVHPDAQHEQRTPSCSVYTYDSAYAAVS